MTGDTFSMSRSFWWESTFSMRTDIFKSKSNSKFKLTKPRLRLSLSNLDMLWKYAICVVMFAKYDSFARYDGRVLLLLLLISTPLLRIRSLWHFFLDLIAKEMIYLRIDLVHWLRLIVRVSQKVAKVKHIANMNQLLA